MAPRRARPASRTKGHHKDGTFASGSALTDGTRIYAFIGSRGLYALDMKGAILWQKDLGLMRTRNGFGEGSSATVHGATLVITWDHEEADFIAAFDSATGKELWRQTRDEPTTWATPHVVVHDGKPQVVVNGTNRLISYDLATGAPVWQTAGTTLNVIPSPVSANGMVYAMAGFRGNSLKAIKLAEAKGDVTGTPAVAFTYDKDTPYVPSPLLYKGGLYFLKSNSGILTQLDAATGAVRYMQRLEATPNVYASPVGANGVDLHRRTRGHDRGARSRPRVQDARHQPARRADRRVAGARRQRALHPRQQAPLPHLVVDVRQPNRRTSTTETRRTQRTHRERTWQRPDEPQHPGASVGCQSRSPCVFVISVSLWLTYVIRR